jgi:hypothetical protein
VRLPFASTLLFLAAQSAAGEISLALPIDCVLGKTCHIQQTVDHDPSENASDFACGFLTYDGHKGTDFALPSMAAQAAGVDVFAAAPGTVRGVRNDMQDRLQTGANAPDVTGKECGNGVVVNHGDGWETQYCHLAKGSIEVRSGDTVAIGTVLGQVGLSGQTQFPHLHLSVRKDSNVVDPFDPDGLIACIAPSASTLWSIPIDAPPGGLIAAGFAAGVPEYDVIKAGSAAAETLQTSDPLVVWGFIFGGREADEINLQIFGPEGEVVDQTVILERTQSQLFRATGRRAPTGGWLAGDYTGEIQLVREGNVLSTATTSVTLN